MRPFSFIPRHVRYARVAVVCDRYAVGLLHVHPHEAAAVHGRHRAVVGAGDGRLLLHRGVVGAGRHALPVAVGAGLYRHPAVQRGYLSRPWAVPASFAPD